MNKKIVMYLGYYYPNIGGVQKVVSELASKLSGFGFNITIITCNTENVSTFENCAGTNIIRLPCWNLINKTYPIPKPNLLTIKILFNQLRSDYDIIFTHTRFYPLCFLGFLISKIKNLPLLHVEHGSQHSISNSHFISYINRIYDHFFGFLIVRFSFQNICISQKTMDFVRHLGGKKNILIHNGIDEFKCYENSQEKYLKISDIITITFIGRLIYAKGIQDLISIVPLINGKIKILIIGEGPYKPDLQRLSEKINTGNIFFMGEIGYHEIPEILASTDICINPSYSEGLPTSVMESLAAGCPTIATNVGGTNEIIDDNVNGFLYPPGNQNILVQKINFLIDHVEIREKFKKTAQEKIRSEYSWEIIIKKWLVVLSTATKKI